MKTIFAAILAMSISTCVFAVEATAPSPARVASSDQDQLIDRLLTVSGMKKFLQNLPAQTATGFMQAALRNDASEDEKKELVTLLGEAYPKDVFVNRVSAALKTNYNEQRYSNFLQLLSTPLATRMLELEKQEPNPADVQAFLAQVSKHPLPPERIKLIQSMDTATQSSTLLTAMTIASIEAGAFAAGDDCSLVTAKIKKMIVKSRPEIEKANRSSAQVMLAFTYRNVSDADLASYLKVYEDKNSKWVQDIAQAAIKEQFKSSMEKGAQGMKRIVQAHKRKKTMFAPKCGQSESPNDEPV